MWFGSLIVKNLTRRPLRSALTLLALTTAIAAVVALLGISRGFTRSFADVYAAHAVDIVVSRQGSADRLSSSIDQGFAGKIAKFAQVERTAAVLLETMSLEDDGIYGIPSMGIASDSWMLDDYNLETNQNDSSSGQLDDTWVLEGTSRRDRFGRQTPNERVLMLGVHLADRLGLGPGGTVSLFDEPYRVSAVFRSPSAWENGSIIFPLDELQRLTDRAGQATYINVVLGQAGPGGAVKSQRAQAVLQEIKALDAKLLPLATAEFVATDTRMQLASAMAWMTSAIALILGSIGTLNTMLTSVLERTHEIGILRAIGWPKRRVVSMILLESCGLAAVASLFGIAVAMLLTWGLAQAPAAAGILRPAIDKDIMLQGGFLALVIGLLGAALPAWRAASLLPTEAFREN